LTMHIEAGRDIINFYPKMYQHCLCLLSFTNI